MKEQIILILLLISLIASTGCIQVSSQANSCSSDGGVLGVSYVERTYLWGDDGPLTKKYDATFYVFGFPQVKTGITEYELNSYKQTYCYQSSTTAKTTVYSTVQGTVQRTVIPTATPAPLIPGGSGFTTLMTVTGQSGKTSDTFFVPVGYWELWYTADPLTTGGQDSKSASGSNSAIFPILQIQVIDNSGSVVETVEPPGGLDKTLWVKLGIDPRPWKQKFYEGNKEYHLVITAQHLRSYAIEARIPK